MGALKTNTQFVERANKLHNNFYQYPGPYVNSQTKVKIICPIHGAFHQRPAPHVFGQGCPKCAYKRNSLLLTTTNAEFLTAANKAHNNFYQYPDEYVGSMTRLNIMCPIHGVFSLKPANHIRGGGCPTCGRLAGIVARTLTTPAFIEKAHKVHSNFYNYNKTVYTGTNVKVIITCPIDGDFLQAPAVHLAGHGCTACGRRRHKVWNLKGGVKLIKGD